MTDLADEEILKDFVSMTLRSGPVLDFQGNHLPGGAYQTGDTVADDSANFNGNLGLAITPTTNNLNNSTDWKVVLAGPYKTFSITNLSTTGLSSLTFQPSTTGFYKEHGSGSGSILEILLYWNATSSASTSTFTADLPFSSSSILGNVIGSSSSIPTAIPIGPASVNSVFLQSANQFTVKITSPTTTVTGSSLFFFRRA